MEASGYKRNEKVHTFFQTLYQASKNTFKSKESDAEKVTNIAKKHFQSFFSLDRNFNTGQNIYGALRVLKSEIPYMSPREAEEELSGAHYGLISLFNQAKGPETSDLKNWFNFANKCKSYANNVFFIKKLANENPNLRSTLNNPRFFLLYEQFIDLSGRDQLDAKTILSIAAFCKDHPAQIDLLEEILKTGAETRDINRQLVSQGKMPMIEDPQNSRFMHELMPKITEYYANNQKKEYEDFKLFLNEIYFNRVFIPNTQIHKDGLYLAFNTFDEHALSTRLRARIQQHEKIQRDKINELKDKEQKESDPDKKLALQHELEILNSLQGYYPRASGYGYQTSRWDPLIEADQPIIPLVRIIGFANSKGQKNETVTSLDLTEALGKENLALSIKEKQVLSLLLIACDTVFLNDPSVLDTWRTGLPNEIQRMLATFNDPAGCPHLSALAEDKKLELVELGLKFARDVNLNFARVFFDTGSI